MSLDFQQILEQVKEMGENVLVREARLEDRRKKAISLINEYAQQLQKLRQVIAMVVKDFDPALRSALPSSEPLDGRYPSPPFPKSVTVLAADGSQISPDRDAEVEYCLINVGAIQMCYGSQEAPFTTVRSKLLYDEQLYTSTGTLTEAALALMRDLNERKMLVELAVDVEPPVITFTDGPMELWRAKDLDSGVDFQESLTEYTEVLSRLCQMGVATAGYVDKPAANLVVRLLEVALLPEDQLPKIRETHPLRGVTDIGLFRNLLEPGERSAVFAIQSKAAVNYRDRLALHFFYLNVGRPDRPSVARVEVPAWVVERKALLDNLHAVLVNQCQIMGGRPYPYLLHRAHETAVVTLREKEQVIQMIALELMKRGLPVEGLSHKQALKDLPGRMRYS